MPKASLAMYDMLAPVRAANDLLWTGIRDRLRLAGIAAPDALDREISYHGIWLQPDLLLAQTCGYPFVKQLRGKVRLVATPVYNFPGGMGAERASFLVARDRNKAASLEDFRGSRAAVNEHLSNSGMNLFRAALAPLAKGEKFFSEVILTGGHQPSMQAVQEGRADIASIDTVTWGMLARHAPELLAGLRIVGETPRGPGLPFITSLATSESELETLRAAIADSISDKNLSEATDALGLTGIEILDEEHYAGLERLSAEAERLNYPIIA